MNGTITLDKSILDEINIAYLIFNSNPHINQKKKSCQLYKSPSKHPSRSSQYEKLIYFHNHNKLLSFVKFNNFVYSLLVKNRLDPIFSQYFRILQKILRKLQFHFKALQDCLKKKTWYYFSSREISVCEQNLIKINKKETSPI